MNMVRVMIPLMETGQSHADGSEPWVASLD